MTEGDHLRDELQRLVPLPTDRHASWPDVLRRGATPPVPLRRGRRRRVALALAATTLIVALPATPVGGALARGLGDFSAWLTGLPGDPASESVQQDFERSNARSWAQFPPGTQLRRLISTEAAGGSFVLYGFRVGESLCLRPEVHGIRARGAATGCAPLGELRRANAPVLVVVTDYGFGRQDVAPTEEGLIPARASATFGIVADGVEAVELATDQGSERAVVANNAFLQVTPSPSLGLRTKNALAIRNDGTRVSIPVAQSPFDDDQPEAQPGVPPGPQGIERHVTEGTIGWLVRREPHGESPDEAGLEDRPFLFGRMPAAEGFARVVRPDPAGYMRVALSIADFQNGSSVCSFLVMRGGAGGGCSPLGRMFERSPFTWGISVAFGGDQYAVLHGLASDDVARMEMFLASGECVAVPLADNAFVVEAARTTFPLRLVAYDEAGRVIGNEAFTHDPLARTGPRAVEGEQRVVRRVVGPNGGAGVLRVGPGTDGGRCFRISFDGGAGGSGCVPRHSKLPDLALGIQGSRRDKFLTGSVSARVAQLRLRLRDGGQVTVEPVEGFVLYAVPVAGLELALGIDEEGREVARQAFHLAATRRG
ncbi:MAG: hypothetical protein ABR583_11785 [Gaiellaceae bacterium]